MHKNYKIILALALFFIGYNNIAKAQKYNVVNNTNNVVKGNYSDSPKRILQGIEYNFGTVGTVSNNSEHTPFWLNSNKYGLGGEKLRNSHIRGGVFRNYENDANRKWKIGYGMDFVLAHNYTSDFLIQQLYADFGYKKVLLSVGAKERPANLKNAELSTGSQTIGINARPIPEVRLEIPDYFYFSKKNKWVGLKAHISYGKMTDDNWQESFTSKKFRYTTNTLYHSKSAFVRIGNEEKFPLTFEGGMEMAATFGGKFYDGKGNHVNMYDGIKDFFDVLVARGSDVGESTYKNASGNTVGSWLCSLKYQGKDWAIRAYYDHFFEDHSALFFEYGWKDGLYGLELTLPKNRIANSFVYEYIYTKYQSGPIYHDKTPVIGDQISASDNYYNHRIYTGWQHWGQAIGNPLFISPIYNSNGELQFNSNRFSGHHFGLSGNPIDDLHYRLLFTHMEHLGTYDIPLKDKKYQRSFLCEITYSPKRIFNLNTKGLSATVAFAYDNGSVLGDNTGFQFAISKTGLFSF